MTTSAKKRLFGETALGEKRARVVPNWAVQLEEKGYAVVPGVLTDAECQSAADKIFSYLKSAGVDVTTPDIAKDYPNTHGIIQHLEVGHAAGVWEVRSNPKVQHVFEQIYGTNDLVSSFDGLCLMQPWHRFGAKPWSHMDQSSKVTSRQCIQGYVNLTDASDENTGSLYVIPGSHKKFAAFFEKFPEMREKSKGDWCKLENEEQRAFFGEDAIRVHGPRGSMVLWDSRTVHQSIPPVNRETAKQRLVVYTCFQPRRLLSERNLKKKQKAFDEFRNTTHWAASKFKLFGKKPRTYGKEVREFAIVRDRVETQRVLELAGKLPMTSQPLRTSEPFLEFVY